MPAMLSVFVAKLTTKYELKCGQIADARREYKPSESYEYRSGISIIILRLMKQLGNILSNCFKVSLLTHFLYHLLQAKKI
jgi:hypothetical protein